jgi:hypothetical protein
LVVGSMLAACGGGGGGGAADVTAPVEPYVDEDKLENIEEEEAAAALGGENLSQADSERIVALDAVGRRWFVAITPVWENLSDPEAPLSEFVALFEEARPTLAEVVREFSATVAEIDDAGLAEGPASLGATMEEILASLDELSAAVSTGDQAAITDAGSRVDAAIAEAERVAGEYLERLRDYIDEEAFCASRPDGGAGLGELCQ